MWANKFGFSLILTMIIISAPAYPLDLKKGGLVRINSYYCIESADAKRLYRKFPKHNFSELNAHLPPSCISVSETDNKLELLTEVDVPNVVDLSGNSYKFVLSFLRDKYGNLINDKKGFLVVPSHVNVVASANEDYLDQTNMFALSVGLHPFDNMGILGQEFDLDKSIYTDPFSNEKSVADSYNEWTPTEDQQTPADIVGGERAS